MKMKVSRECLLVGVCCGSLRWTMALDELELEGSIVL